MAWLAALWAPAHPIHSSVTEMRYNLRAKALETSVRIFTDDLENALATHARRPRVDLRDTAQARALLVAYLAAHLQPGCGKGPWHYLGYEQEGDATWIHLEWPAATCQRGQLTNRILLDQFADQVNVVNLTVGDRQQTLVCSRRKWQVEFSF